MHMDLWSETWIQHGRAEWRTHSVPRTTIMTRYPLYINMHLHQLEYIFREDVWGKLNIMKLFHLIHPFIHLFSKHLLLPCSALRYLVKGQTQPFPHSEPKVQIKSFKAENLITPRKGSNQESWDYDRCT